MTIVGSFQEKRRLKGTSFISGQKVGLEMEVDQDPPLQAAGWETKMC